MKDSQISSNANSNVPTNSVFQYLIPLMVLFLLVVGVFWTYGDSILPKTKVVDISIAEDCSVETSLPLDFEKDEQVVLRISSERVSEFHIHGYNIEKSVSNKQSVVQFKSTLEGEFAYELHDECGELGILTIGEVSHSHDHSSHSHDEGMEHNHQSLAVDNWTSIPDITFELLPDMADNDLNVHIQLTNFNFAPERVNMDSIEGEGHAHLYIDGEKVTRIYGEWFLINDLAPGEHEITVTLNANNHQSLTYQGEEITHTEFVIIP